MINIIISRTPYRVSFTGGMSDLPDYYLKYGNGAVVSTTIDKYIYIILNEWRDNKFRLVYSQVEDVDKVEDIKHPLIRECLKLLDINKPLEIMSIGDIRAGSGLGSSASFTVGLLHTLHTYKGDNINKHDLAEEAFKVEVEILKSHGGKQDQYAAAYGGINFIEFTPKNICVSPIKLSYELHSELSQNLMLFNTNLTRSSDKVLTPITQNMKEISNKVGELVKLAKEMNNELRKENINLNNFGKLISKDWDIKRISGNISNREIDMYINKAMEAGAIGVKLCGAGLGGFILIYCKKRYQNDVRKVLSNLRELEFNLDNTGSKIIYE